MDSTRKRAKPVPMHQILIVEDQQKLRRNLQQVLEKEGYLVTAAATGEEGFRLATTHSFDAIVLDLTLPQRDGLQVLSDLRARGHSNPVLILTARDTVEDRVAGLDHGGDDYLVKPFAHAELLARLRALLRRGTTRQDLILRCGALQIDLVPRRVSYDGLDVELSQREFDLLEFLVRHKNTNVSREMLARDVWKDPGGVMTNVIDVCVNGLRRKLDRLGDRHLIRTVRGIGYTVRDP